MKGIFKSELGKKSVLKSYGLLLEQWGTEYTEVSAETDYGKTQVITAGNPSKPPLLLFHGVGDNSALMWVFNAAVLAEHYYVIAVDTIGGPGKSEPNRNYYTGIDHIKWIEQVTGQFGISTMYTAGVSNGAYLAQLLTVRKPDTVIKSVIMSGTAAVKGGTAGMMKMMRVFLPEALFPTEKNVIRLLRKLSGPGHHIFTENKELLNHWSLLLKYFNPRAMSPHKYTVISPAELDILREKACFLIGSDDPLCGSREVQILTENKLTFKIIHDAGHGINHEKADEVNREIIKFLGTENS